MNSTEFKPIGGQMLTNWGGIEVMLSDAGDGLWYRYNYGETPDEPKEAEIEYFNTEQDGTPFDECHDDESRPGFETDKGVRFYLDEIMRFNR